MGRDHPYPGDSRRAPMRYDCAGYRSGAELATALVWTPCQGPDGDDRPAATGRQWLYGLEVLDDFQERFSSCFRPLISWLPPRAWGVDLPPLGGGESPGHTAVDHNEGCSF